MLPLCSRICQNHWSLWDFKTWFTVLFNAASVRNSCNILVGVSLNTKLWERKAHFEAYPFWKFSHFLFLIYINSLQNNGLLAFTNHTHMRVACYVILCYVYGYSNHEGVISSDRGNCGIGLAFPIQWPKMVWFGNSHTAKFQCNGAPSSWCIIKGCSSCYGNASFSHTLIHTTH
jgi:hypothetical protein